MTASGESPSERAESAVRALSAKTTQTPLVALILGSGLSGVVDSVQPQVSTSTAELLGAPSTSVTGHSGKVILGTLAGVPLIVFLGRIHLYEGHSPEEQTLPVLLASRLGARVLLLTNASGGINPDMAPGELMLISDQINMTGEIVLPGSVPSGPDDPWADDRCLYDRSFSDMLLESAASAGVEIHRGVYAGGVGPSYETAAEIRMLKRMGADAVGMSTVLEALAGRRLGMRVAGISVITNLATGISPSRLSHDEVTSGAALAVERLRAVIQGFLVRVAALR